jgi:hypothetical protein
MHVHVLFIFGCFCRRGEMDKKAPGVKPYSKDLNGSIGNGLMQQPINRYFVVTTFEFLICRLAKGS